MCGSGSLPALVAGRARDRGWRVLAFTFDGPGALHGAADRVVESRLTELAPVLALLQEEQASAAVLVGRFAMPEILRIDTGGADRVTQAIGERAGSRVDARLVEAAIGTLTAMGIEVLDQRVFLGDLLPEAGSWSQRQPTAEERDQVRRGLALARTLAAAGIGQTVVLRHAAVTAVEAVEGTTEAIRRGTALAGPGAIIVKAAAPSHDYRVDTPLIGPDTIAAAVAGQAAVLAVEAGRVGILDRAACTAAADASGLSLLAAGDD